MYGTHPMMDTASNTVSTIPTDQKEYFTLLVSDESNNVVSVIS